MVSRFAEIFSASHAPHLVPIPTCRPAFTGPRPQRWLRLSAVGRLQLCAQTARKAISSTITPDNRIYTVNEPAIPAVLNGKS